MKLKNTPRAPDDSGGEIIVTREVNVLAGFEDMLVDETSRALVRGIDDADGVNNPLVVRLPIAPELMALSLERRVNAIWDSGVSPTSTEMIEAFLSCDGIGRGMWVAAAAPTGLPPNPKFYRGEGRFDDLVWPDGFPFFRPRRPKRSETSPLLRRPTKAEQLSNTRELYSGCGLFIPLGCGCLDLCQGAAFHAAIAAEDARRKREEEEAHVAFAEMLVRATYRP